MFRLDPVAAFEEMFLKSPVAKQYAEDFGASNNSSSTGINATPSNPTSSHGLIFHRLKQPVSKGIQQHRNIAKSTVQQAETEDEMFYTPTAAAGSHDSAYSSLTMAPTIRKQVNTSLGESSTRSPAVYLTPELQASRQVPNAHDLGTDPSVSILRNGKEVACSVKREPMDTSDDLPSLAQQHFEVDTATEEDVSGNSDLESTGTVHPVLDSRPVKNNYLQASKEEKKIGNKKKRAVIAVDDWIIVPWGNSDCGICVEGHRRIDKCGEYWKSSRIVRRINNRLVQTQSGQQYRLVGSITKHDALQHGFKEYMVDAFVKGFPPNWEDYVDEYIRNRNNEINVETETKPDVVESMNNHDESLHSRNKKVIIRKSKRENAPRRFFDDTPKGVHEAVAKTIRKRNEKTKEKSVEVPKNKKEDTKVSEPVSLGDLPKTRSGRTIKPPVQHWCGQRYIYSSLTDNVDVERPDLSVTPASDVSLNGTPVVTFKIDPHVKLMEKRARQEVLNVSLTKKRNRKRKKDNSLNSDSQDITLDCYEGTTDSEIQCNFGGSPTSYKMRNRDTETSMEKRYAEALANTLKDADGTPLSAVGESSSNKLRLRKSLELEMDSEVDMFSGDDGEAISKVKRRNRNVIVSSEDSDADSRSNMKRSNNTLLRKVLVNRSVQNVDIIEALKTPVSDKRRVIDDLNNRKGKKSQLNGRPHVVLDRLEIKPLEPVKRVQESLTDSDCLTDDSPVAKTVTRQTETQKTENKKTRTKGDNSTTNSLGEQRKTRGRPRKTKLLPVISEEAVGNDGDVKENQKSRGSASRAHRGQGRKRQVESEVTESEPEVKKTSSTKGRTVRTKASRNRKKNSVQKEPVDEELSIEEMLRGIGRSSEGKNKENSGGRKKGKILHDLTDQSDDENSDPPWTDSEVRSLRQAISNVKGDTPYYWEVVADRVATRNALQCQQFHQGEAPSTVKKKTKSKAQKQKVTQLSEVTARKGTMKRKQQFRELVEHHNMAGEEDEDYFSSTPMRSNKRTMIGSPMDDSFSAGLSSMQTPAVLKMLTPNTRMSHLLMSERKTSASHLHIVTPKVINSVDRKEGDNYIHRIKNRKSIRAPHPSQTQGSHMKESNVKATSDMFETHQVPQNDVDSDEEEDFYFSEGD